MKKASFIVLLVAAFMTFGAHESSAQWVHTGGPESTWVSALVTVGTRLVAGTDRGVFVRTGDQDSWSPAEAAMARRQVECLAAVGSNVFAGIDWPDLEGVSDTVLGIIKGGVLGGIARSEDGGLTWRPAWSGLPRYTKTMALAAIGTSIYVGADVDEELDTAGGVFTSTDAGESWMDTGAMSAPFIASAGGALYGEFMLDGFCRSTDGGRRWKPAGKGLPAAAILSLAAGANALFLGTSKGLYVSTDDAATWKSASAGLPANTAVRRLAVAGTRVFAATPNAVFVSGNKGQSWVTAGTGLPADVVIWSLAATGTEVFAGTEGKGVWRLPLAGLAGSGR
jgi:hypothetical protein